jgi:hypothetical protein
VVQSLHPVLIRARRRLRVPDDLRALRVQVRHYAASRNYGGPLPRVPPPGLGHHGPFVVGILLVPSLTSSIFSGQAGQSIPPEPNR